MNFTHEIASLTWELCRESATESVISEHEQILGVKFPPDFRAVIKLCPGGQPVERSDFNLQHPGAGNVESCLGALLTLGPADDDVDGILDTARSLHDTHGLSRQIIPFATDGMGDYMCLDFRRDPLTPAIVYWSHETRIDDAIAHLADSFDEFLAMLAPPESVD